jgi:hypothetical protein
MAHSYSFAVIRLAPDDGRDERINIGLVVFNNDSVDVRSPRRLDKIRAMSSALEPETLFELINNVKVLDEKLRDKGVQGIEERFQRLASFGPISLSQLGTFVAHDASAYEERLSTIMKAMVDTEPAAAKHREKRSKLLTQVKRIFRQERVLAKRDEDLSSHRIVSGYALDEGLVADLVLRNGAMHVVETVDASGSEDSLRKAISEVAVAALVLERARMKFGTDRTKAKLVYSASASLEKVARPSLDAAAHQGAELTNWASADERNKFIHSLAMLATPVPSKNRKTKFVGTLPKLPL